MTASLDSTCSTIYQVRPTFQLSFFFSNSNINKNLGSYFFFQSLLISKQPFLDAKASHPCYLMQAQLISTVSSGQPRVVFASLLTASGQGRSPFSCWTMLMLPELKLPQCSGRWQRGDWVLKLLFLCMDGLRSQKSFEYYFFLSPHKIEKFLITIIILNNFEEKNP